jgi:hypothetical protein
VIEQGIDRIWRCVVRISSRSPSGVPGRAAIRRSISFRAAR